MIKGAQGEDNVCGSLLLAIPGRGHSDYKIFSRRIGSERARSSGVYQYRKWRIAGVAGKRGAWRRPDREDKNLCPMAYEIEGTG